MTASINPIDVPAFDAVSIKILEAALAEFTEFGLRRVSVDDIAGRAGVHRTTIYRYFKTKQEIIQAAAAKWIQDLFVAVAIEVGAQPTIEDQLVEGWATCFGRILDSPLVQRILSTDTDAGVRAVTVDGGPALTMVSGMFAVWLKQACNTDIGGDFDPEGLAEIVARLGLSMVLTPQSHFHLDSADGRREFARRYLVPFLPASRQS
ncbi:TetR/AcrR family transcriptional regulator [Smaragdicoccus niigatensis]|uniref:TetR/AcrR family transcriptional regulator n=1 Tax=Smaragdicoccus niigatensis TaxID=359359 RepID=UPI000361A9A3|nr:TetR/AcrR family transcriptional regulator [Smaragdicoccus niigatensis]